MGESDVRLSPLVERRDGDGDRRGRSGRTTRSHGSGSGGGGAPPGRGRVPSPDRGDVGVTDVSWTGTLKRTLKEFGHDNLTSWAAALTYFGILALFPAALVFVSILGLIGEDATQPLLDNLGEVAPGQAQQIATTALESVQQNQGASGIALIIGLAAALWSASGYVGAFMPASNVVWDVEEGRPIWKRYPVRLGVTLLLLVLLAIAAVMVIVTGPIAQAVGDVIGLGDQAVLVWDIAKWPVLLLVVSLMLAILYWAAPNVRQPGFRFISPGSIIAVVVWLLASVAFTVYVANFSSYNETYGTFGGIIVFLVWLWITNIAVLFGAEFNAELERGRQIEAGMRPADREPFLPPRDEPKDTSPVG
jgi:membrane protein